MDYVQGTLYNINFYRWTFIYINVSLPKYSTVLEMIFVEHLDSVKTVSFKCQLIVLFDLELIPRESN